MGPEGPMGPQGPAGTCNCGDEFPPVTFPPGSDKPCESASSVVAALQQMTTEMANNAGLAATLTGLIGAIVVILNPWLLVPVTALALAGVLAALVGLSGAAIAALFDDAFYNQLKIYLYSSFDPDGVMRDWGTTCLHNLLDGEVGAQWIFIQKVFDVIGADGINNLVNANLLGGANCAGLSKVLCQWTQPQDLTTDQWHWAGTNFDPWNDTAQWVEGQGFCHDLTDVPGACAAMIGIAFVEPCFVTKLLVQCFDGKRFNGQNIYVKVWQVIEGIPVQRANIVINTDNRWSSANIPLQEGLTEGFYIRVGYSEDVEGSYNPRITYCYMEGRGENPFFLY